MGKVFIQDKLKQKSRLYIFVIMIMALGLFVLKTDIYAQEVNTKKATIQTTLKDKKSTHC